MEPVEITRADVAGAQRQQGPPAFMRGGYRQNHYRGKLRRRLFAMHKKGRK